MDVNFVQEVTGIVSETTRTINSVVSICWMFCTVILLLQLSFLCSDRRLVTPLIMSTVCCKMWINRYVSILLTSNILIWYASIMCLSQMGHSWKENKPKVLTQGNMCYFTQYKLFVSIFIFITGSSTFIQYFFISCIYPEIGWPPSLCSVFRKTQNMFNFAHIYKVIITTPHPALPFMTLI